MNEIQVPLSEIERLQEAAKAVGIEIPIQAPFTPSDINKLLPLLRMPLNSAAIQSATAAETGKGYDSIGYSYQAHIDRMNWVFGPTQWRWKAVDEECEETATAGGYVKFTSSCEIVLQIGYRDLNPESKQWEWLTVHELEPIPSDHESLEKGSARKGCLTKGIKRATSFLGVGADAYLGTLDDDMTTGAARNDQLKTPIGGRAKIIDSKGYQMLKSLASTKGFTEDTKLREFYKAESGGIIHNDPANLTKTEASEVKNMLFKLPNAILNEDEEPDDKSSDDEVSNNEVKPKRPSTLADLMSSDDMVIKSIAAEYSFKLPDAITLKNKSAICKTLATLMGIK
ncbi:RAD52 family DNA repair protein [Paenibacillus sp. CAU 1782]